MSKKKFYFWTSYSDLMTSLFVIMLVLFVMALAMFKSKNHELEVSNEDLRKIIGRYQQITRLEEQIAPLQTDKGFYYLDACQKFVVSDLMGVEIFDPYQTTIRHEFIKPAIEAGRKIEDFIGRLDSDLQYLLVIEGNMANRWDRSIGQDDMKGYTTSYLRALAVYNLWVENGINFRKDNIEVMICGSGFNGLCRESPEENNKRFSVQIIPKVSHIKMDLQTASPQLASEQE